MAEERAVAEVSASEPGRTHKASNQGLADMDTLQACGSRLAGDEAIREHHFQMHLILG